MNVTNDINNMIVGKNRQLEEIDEKYKALLKELDDKSNSLNAQIAEIRKSVEKERRPLTPEEKALFNEFSKLGGQYADLDDEWGKESQKALNEAQTSPLLHTLDAGKALEHIKDGVPRLIYTYSFMAKSEPVDGQKQSNAFHYMLTDNAALKDNLYSTFSQQLKFLEETAPDTYKEACNFIDNCIVNKNNLFFIEGKNTEIIPRYTTRVPTEMVLPTAKLSTLLFEGKLYKNKYPDYNLIDGEYLKVVTSNDNSKEEYYTLANCDYDDKAIQLSGEITLTNTDRRVHDAIVTLYVAGKNEYITPQMIQRAMKGNKSRPTQAGLEEIRNSLNKLMSTYMSINIKFEDPKTKKKFTEKNISLTYKGAVIYAEIATLKMNGKIVEEVYHILREPYIYTYSDAKKQVTRVKPSIATVDTSGKRSRKNQVGKNTETLDLTYYLMSRIETMKNKNNKNMKQKIKYETIFEKIGLEITTDGASRKKQTIIRNKVRKIFSNWIEQGYIKNYEEYKEGRKIVGIRIIL